MKAQMVFLKNRPSSTVRWLSPELAEALKASLVEKGVYPGTQVEVKEGSIPEKLQVIFTGDSDILAKIKSDFLDPQSPLNQVTQYEQANGITSLYGEVTPL